MIAGAWCFLFTLIACVLGMVPKLDYAANPSAWWFQLASNILTPIVLILLGMLLPFIARREQRKTNGLDLNSLNVEYLPQLTNRLTILYQISHKKSAFLIDID